MFKRVKSDLRKVPLQSYMWIHFTASAFNIINNSWAVVKTSNVPLPYQTLSTIAVHNQTPFPTDVQMIRWCTQFLCTRPLNHTHVRKSRNLTGLRSFHAGSSICFPSLNICEYVFVCDVWPGRLRFVTYLTSALLLNLNLSLSLPLYEHIYRFFCWGL